MIFNRARQGSLGGGGGGSGGASYAHLNEPLILPYNLAATGSISVTTETMDAATEKAAFIGQIVLEGGTGSKVISSAGGKIHWLAGTNTFADAGTTVRVGLQDLDASGLPDGTFDVYDDLVGGTDTLTNSVFNTTTMSAGSKTVANGDFLAIVLDMTARGGADAVRLGGHTQLWADSSPMNVISRYVAAAWTANISGTPAAVIEFDDGTFGWLGLTSVHTAASTVAVNVDTATRDEYGNLFVVPFACKCGGIDVNLTPAAGATFEVCLYSDPLGTPVLVEAKAVEGDDFTGSGYTRVYFSTEHTLLPANTYAITIRPTNTTNTTIGYLDLPPALAKVSGMDSASCYSVARVGNTGAFADWNGGTAKSRRMRLSALITSVKASQT